MRGAERRFRRGSPSPLRHVEALDAADVGDHHHNLVAHRAARDGARCLLYTRSSAINEVLWQWEHRTFAIVISWPKCSNRAPAIAFPSSASMVAPTPRFRCRRAKALGSDAPGIVSCPTSDCAAASTNPWGRRCRRADARLAPTRPAAEARRRSSLDVPASRPATGASARSARRPRRKRRPVARLGR